MDPEGLEKAQQEDGDGRPVEIPANVLSDKAREEVFAAGEAAEAQEPKNEAELEEKIDALKQEAGLVEENEVVQKIQQVKEKYGENKWWESDDPRVKALGQLNERTLILSPDDFVESVSAVVGRPISAQELPMARELIEQADWEKERGELSTQEGVEALMESSQSVDEWEQNKSKVEAHNYGPDGKVKMPEFWDDGKMGEIKERLRGVESKRRMEALYAKEKADLDARNAAFEAEQKRQQEIEANNPPPKKGWLKSLFGR